MNTAPETFPGSALARRPSGGHLKSGALPLSRYVLSFPVMLAFALAVLIFCTTRNRLNDPDTWWHLKVGESIWNTRSLPQSDHYSFTAKNHPWIAHEWLAEVSMFTAYKLGGYRTLWLWLAGFGSLLCILLYVLCWWYSGNAKVSLLGGMMVWFFGTVNLALRPLILGHLFLVVELMLIHLGRTRGRRWLWGLPPLFAVWVNCHGSHIFGLAVLAVFVVSSRLDFQVGLLVSRSWEQQSRRLLQAMFPLCIAALFANPIGWRLPAYPFDLLLKQTLNLAHISEWNPLDFQKEWGLGMLAVIAVCGSLVLLRRAQLRLDELILFLAGVFMAVRHTRMVFVFGILAAPMLCRLLADLWDRWDPGRENRTANAALIVASIAVLAAVFPRDEHLRMQVQKNNPVGAVEFIRKTGLSGPMLNEYVFGGYLIWALPEHKVFIDGRADIFDWSGVFEEFARWSNLKEDPAILLEKYGIRFCLLRSTNAMVSVLPYLPGWKEVYSDDISVVFARN